MIQTIALTILMPVTTAIPTNPARLPGPAMPVNINQSIRLPGPVVPAAKITLDIPRPAGDKAPSAIDTLRKLVKDDRPDFAKSAFDHVTLPEGDLEREIGVPPVRVGR